VVDDNRFTEMAIQEIQVIGRPATTSTTESTTESTPTTTVGETTTTTTP
jgi:hypothetical protein